MKKVLLFRSVFALSLLLSTTNKSEVPLTIAPLTATITAQQQSLAKIHHNNVSLEYVKDYVQSVINDPESTETDIALARHALVDAQLEELTKQRAQKGVASLKSLEETIYDTNIEWHKAVTALHGEQAFYDTMIKISPASDQFVKEIAAINKKALAQIAYLEKNKNSWKHKIYVAINNFLYKSTRYISKGYNLNDIDNTYGRRVYRESVNISNKCTDALYNFWNRNQIKQTYKDKLILRKELLNLINNENVNIHIILLTKYSSDIKSEKLIELISIIKESKEYYLLEEKHKNITLKFKSLYNEIRDILDFNNPLDKTIIKYAQALFYGESYFIDDFKKFFEKIVSDNNLIHILYGMKNITVSQETINPKIIESGENASKTAYVDDQKEKEKTLKKEENDDKVITPSDSEMENVTITTDVINPKGAELGAKATEIVTSTIKTSFDVVTGFMNGFLKGLHEDHTIAHPDSTAIPNTPQPAPTKE